MIDQYYQWVFVVDYVVGVVIFMYFVVIVVYLNYWIRRDKQIGK